MEEFIDAQSNLAAEQYASSGEHRVVNVFKRNE